MILRNSAICNSCKQEIVSRHKHNYVTCSCGATSVDGGLSYLQRSGDNYTETSLNDKDSFEKIRNNFEWGSKGVDGNEPLRYVKLKDMETSHIMAILDTQKQHPFVFLKELLNRNNFDLTKFETETLEITFGLEFLKEFLNRK